MALDEFAGNGTNRAPPARPDGKTMPSCPAIARQKHENSKINRKKAISNVEWYR